MSQLSIRITKEEYKLVSIWANQKGLSLAAAYKKITSQAFGQWKEDFLVSQYASGKIRLKEVWKQSGLRLMAFMKLLDEKDINPPHTELMEIKSSEKRQLLKIGIIFKEGIPMKRKTPELEFEEKV